MDYTAAENNLLAPDYDPSEFAPLALLEQGDVDVWVRRRGVILLEKSKETAKECEAGKLACAITVGASVVMSANPLAWVPMVIGAAGYIYVVFQEFQDTGSIRLIPMYRGKLGDILRVMEGGQAALRHPLEDQIEYLSEAEKDEVLLINYRFGEIAGVLNSAPPKVRFDLYRHLCGQFHARRDIITGDEVKHYINAAVSQERRTAMPPQSQPAIQQEEVKARALRCCEAQIAPQPQETTVNSHTPPTSCQRPISNSSPLQPDQWTPDLMGYPSILIYGAQGAGKTSTAAWLIRERINAGHQVKILDPHRAYGQWDGLECIGDGMDYDAINDELKAFTEEIKVRYKARSRTPNYNPPKLTLVCDEFTQWAKKCSHSAIFFEESLTDIRKINLHVLFISHARTLTGLGGSSGLAATRDAGLLELELETQVDPVTKKASPKLLGWLKHPGMAMNERQRVAIASWMNGSMDFSGSGVTSIVKQQPATVADSVDERPQAEEAIAPPNPAIELKISDSLGEPLKAILLFTKEQRDWVTVRDIQRKNFAVLKGKNSEQIHQHLGLLADTGYGQIDEEGKAHSSVAFLAH
jgi:hypothetical protein